MNVYDSELVFTRIAVILDAMTRAVKIIAVYRTRNSPKVLLIVAVLSFQLTLVLMLISQVIRHKTRQAEHIIGSILFAEFNYKCDLF